MDHWNAWAVGGFDPARRALIMNRSVAVRAAIIVAAVISCDAPYVRDNPYDPAVPVTITITGPDSLFSAFEVGTYTAATTPSFPDSAVDWPGVGVPGRSTDYQSAGPPLWPATATVNIQAAIGKTDSTVSFVEGFNTVIVQQIEIYRHVGTKSVVLTQRLTHIALRCPDVHACSSIGVGGTDSVWVDGSDALNQQIYRPLGTPLNALNGTPIATFALRDPSIANLVPVGIRVVAVNAIKAGSTWVIATRGSLVDSLQVVVH
jgi:hypothetical protein